VIEYRNNFPPDPADVIRVFDSSGIKRPTTDPVRIARMFATSNVIISEWESDKLVGLARALTDFSYCCYLSDLAVDRDFQKRGMGKELIRRVQAEIGEEASLILLSAPGAMSYYPKLAFSKIENGFIVNRVR
jgi:ribosomal protein S18 acetylase RimI-like enzyme